MSNELHNEKEGIFVEKQKDIDPEFVEIVNNFWDLVWEGIYGNEIKKEES